MEFAVITGLVTLMGKWLNYDIEKRKLEQAGESAPQPDEEVRKGKQVAEVVEAGMKEHGDKREQRALEDFQDDPEWYQDNLQRALAAVAERNPTFAQQLQDVAKQTNVVQSGGIHGTAEVKGNNTGINIGVNYGTQTQTFGEWPPKKWDT
jgi:hypothetical protein